MTSCVIFWSCIFGCHLIAERPAELCQLSASQLQYQQNNHRHQTSKPTNFSPHAAVNVPTAATLWMRTKCMPCLCEYRIRSAHWWVILNICLFPSPVPGFNVQWRMSSTTRRPASADRTARRQFQATGQPVSRTQDSHAMTSRLPRYEAKCVQRRCFQWESVALCSDIKGTELPLAICWYHLKGNWLRYNIATFRQFIPIMKMLGAS